MTNIAGTPDDDLIDGSGNDDVLRGLAGNDRLRGRGGNDEVHGGDGDDTVTGNEGDDVLYGGAGFDKINGNDGDDTAYGDDKADRIYGHAGDDTLYGDAGNDTIYGGLDNDTIDGGRGIDRLYGDEGDDLIHGGGENDKLFGGDGQDALYGDDGNDGLTGKAGDDTLYGGAGDDSLNGNIGDDVLYGDDGTDRLYGHEGTDTLNGGTGNDFLFGGSGNDILNGDAGADYLDAGSGADILSGGLGNDVVKGRGGADTLYGGDGDDTVNGGEGDDTVSGGLGDDKLVGGSGADTFVISVQGGADRVVDFKVADDVIDLTQLDLRQAGQSDADVYADLIFTRTGSGGRDTIVTFAGASGAGVSVLLEDVKPRDLSVANFVFDGGNENTAPTITSAARVEVAENQTAVLTVQASDFEGDTISYSLSGTDASLFDIEATTGVVTFKAAPDYETSGDAGGNNVYDVTVTASDGTNSTDQAVEVTVTDVLEPVDLTDLSSSQGFIIQGDDANDKAGKAVSEVGDINGDGYGDLIVGSIAGGAYVVFGSASGFGIDVDGRQVIDLTTLSASQGFYMYGESQNDRAGASVASAGDVNGDGFGDLIVGAFDADGGGINSGEAYVVFGSASGFGVDVGGRQAIDLAEMSSSEGFIIQGDAERDSAGFSVSSAGDINGDGFDDLIVGAPRGDDAGFKYGGEAYVVFGSASGFGVDVGGRQIIDLTTLSSSEGFIIQGDTPGDYAGHSVSSAGDINGDGYDDLIVGAVHGSDRGSDGGQAYVVFGTASGFGVDIAGRQVIDLTTLSASQGFVIWGWNGDLVGGSVSSAGDINGDGYDDLIVGASGGENGGYEAGEAYVLFGSASDFGVDIDGRQIIDLSKLATSQGFIIQGDVRFDEAGISVSSAGDINGDGYDDLIVGAWQGDDGGDAAGEAYIVYGSGLGFGVDAAHHVAHRQVLDLTTLTPGQGMIIQGDAAGDYAGISVSSAGDVNGDGYDDLMVGAWVGDDGGTDAGEAYVIFGSATGSTSGLSATGTSGVNTMIGSAGNDTLTGAGGADVIRGGAGDDIIGVSDSAFFRIHGGRGDDTLRVDGSGVNLNFANIAQNTITDIERIDLTGSGNNTLTLSKLDLFDMMEARESGTAILRVTGDAGDGAYLSDASWTSAGQVVEGALTYNAYTNGNARAYVQDGVNVTLGSAGPAQDDLAATKGGGPVVMDGLQPGDGLAKTGETPVMDILVEAIIAPQIGSLDLSLILGVTADGFLTLEESEEAVDLAGFGDTAKLADLVERGDLIEPHLRFEGGDFSTRGWRVLSDTAESTSPAWSKQVPVMDTLDDVGKSANTPVMDSLGDESDEMLIANVETDAAFGWM
jgi:Ca2+-binding RTX toxin-like protein